MARKSKKRREREEAEREELLAPDAFEAHEGDWSSWLEGNLRWLVLGLVAILVGIVGFETMRDSSAAASGEETRALIEVVDTYRDAVSLQEIFTATTAAANQKRYVEAREKLDLSGLSGPRAALAKLYDADLALEAGEPEVALDGFEAYLSSATPKDPIRFFALEGKGYALEALGRDDEALETFRAIAQMPRFSDFGQSHAARVLAANGDVAGAKETYEAIVAREPASPLKTFAEQQLLSLD